MTLTRKVHRKLHLKPLYTRLLKVFTFLVSVLDYPMILDLGQPCADPGSAQEVRLSSGNGGLAVLSDTQLIEVLAHFSRERIPERYVKLVRKWV